MKLQISKDILNKKFIRVGLGTGKAFFPANKIYTPSVIGYNIGHFNETSNVISWLNYSDPNGIRFNITASVIEPNITADNTVINLTEFQNKKNLVRGVKDSSNTYINWQSFKDNYNQINLNSANYFSYAYLLDFLSDRSLEKLINIDASINTFPITNDNDWIGKWSLWRHFYAQAFILSRDYDANHFSMFNEPNVTLNALTEENWFIRYLICSDAIQSAIQDVNLTYSKNIKVNISSPVTANGATKYNGPTDFWGSKAVLNRRLRIDGSTDRGWKNLHTYSYNKYNADFQNYITDLLILKNFIAIDTYGDTFFDDKINIELSEFNVRTAENYDSIIENRNLDKNTDFPALGTNFIGLTLNNVEKIYTFKFAQTLDNALDYKHKKNGTHYVQNNFPYNYGGITKGGEVFRLYKKCAGIKREVLDHYIYTENYLTNIVYFLTKDDKNYYIFAVNEFEQSQILSPNFNFIDIRSNIAYIEEVSDTSNGEVKYLSNFSNKSLAYNSMPPKSVWAVTIPIKKVEINYIGALQNATVTDGASKNIVESISNKLTVRSDGTQDNRKISLIKFTFPNEYKTNSCSVLLELNVSTTGIMQQGVTGVQSNVYNVGTGWNQSTATFSNLNSILKQDVPTGILIENNVVTGYSGILGQITSTGTFFNVTYLDVTKAVKNLSSTGFCCAIAQEHRHDINTKVFPLTSGDLQSNGLHIQTGSRLLFLI